MSSSRGKNLNEKAHAPRFDLSITGASKFEGHAKIFVTGAPSPRVRLDSSTVHNRL